MRRKTIEEFKKELYKINPNIKVLGKYIDTNTKILCECKKDHYQWSPIPNDLLRGAGCPICSNKKVLKGINDMWTTAPDTAKLLANPEDGYKYTRQSSKKVDWKCSDCGNIIKNKTISKIYLRGLSCPHCSDKISYPEKFMYNLLEQLHIRFEYQYSPKWIRPKRYDFYIPSKQLIIEMDGGWHKEDNNLSGQTKEESIEIDTYKSELAKEHNLNIIRIDCINSNFEYIKTNILHSKLFILFKLNNVNWNNIDELSHKSLVKKICIYKKENPNKTAMQIGNVFNLSQITIIKYLKIGNKLNFCNYDAKEEKYKGSRKAGKKNNKAVICINTKIVYESLHKASSDTLANYSDISSCCHKKYNFAGKLPDGTELQWMFLDEYNETNKISHDD